MIPPIVVEVALKYGTKILAGFLALSIGVGGYYYWKHGVITKAKDECNAAWEERDRQDIKKADAIMAAENAKIEIIKQHYQDQFNMGREKLNDYIETLTVANADANAAVARMRNYKATQGKTSCENRVLTSANNTGGIGGTGSETLQTAISLKAVELIIEDYVMKYLRVVNE